MSFILIRNITKSYTEAKQQHVIYDDLNLTLEKGEIIALLGRSGSGKSTLLNLVSGIDLPDKGDITINGENLTQLSENDRTLFRRRHIGFVFQSFNLVPTLSVEENVLLPVELNGNTGPKAREQLHLLLEAVGLEHRKATFPDRLSGGEQQRVAIARALVHKPLLLLADEPTGNLDLETAAQVLVLLEQLVREQHSTLILVTHSYEVTRIADRVLTVEHGKLKDASEQTLASLRDK